jgi:hypothetical protein
MRHGFGGQHAVTERGAGGTLWRATNPVQVVKRFGLSAWLISKQYFLVWLFSEANKIQKLLCQCI